MSPIEENKSILKEMADPDLPFKLVDRNASPENFENVKIKTEPVASMAAYTCSFCSDPFDNEEKLNAHTLSNHLMPLNFQPIIPTNTRFVVQFHEIFVSSTKIKLIFFFNF